MSVIKLFKTGNDHVIELSGEAVALERSLQSLIEANMETFLGVRFLATEFATTHQGRMDSLGLDENNAPVIVEYKRQRNENVINQGLFYLDWLMDHRRDFEWLVLERFGRDVAEKIDWSAPRLICIAGDFTKYDAHAVNQMNRNIELMRYRRFGEELLLLEVLTATTARQSTKASTAATNTETEETPHGTKKPETISQYLSEMDREMIILHDAVDDFLRNLGDDVQVRTLDFYVAYRRLRNFACLEVRNQLKKVRLYLKVEPSDDILELEITKDMRGISHFGTGDLEVSISSLEDLELAKPLIEQSYENS